tara:strand:+ start:12046 stop:13212 length:1167 start_codon:yes stop_codon:yes gene_type:complete
LLNNNFHRSIYIHWPFCLSKCPYCDFNSHVSYKTFDIKTWKNAYINEMQKEFEKLTNKNIKSIFFGGGTPSLMPLKLIDYILNYIAKKCNISSNIEISLEANPSSSEIKRFNALSKIGINRLSIGLQSLNDNSLMFLGRNHSALEGIKAIENAKLFFKNISFDLIYGLPKQTEKNWELELSKAILLSDKHISAYQLTIEKGTPFYAKYKNKEIILPSEKTLFNLYKLTDELLKNKKLKKYEVSNYANKGAESIHNTAIWKGHEYSGFGPGAHGRLKINNEWYETKRYPSPYIWLNKCIKNNETLLINNKISSKQRAQEILLTSLRLTKGLNISELNRLCDLNSSDKIINEKMCNILEKEKFLKIKNNNISITNKGFPILNSIINKIIL